MIREELLDILVCPESRMPLKHADAATLEKVNQASGSGRLVNRGGQPVTSQFECGLIREDGAWFYPVVDGIPDMLKDEAISLEGLMG